MCLASPIAHTPCFDSGGSQPPVDDCSGVYTLDMNCFAAGGCGGMPLPALTTIGTRVNCQWFGRDDGFAAPNNVTLTDALEYFVCP